MDVEGPFALVALRDASELQVSIEDPDESIGDGKNRHLAWQSSRDRLSSSASIRLEQGELLDKPGSQIFRQVGPDDDAVAFPVLLIVGIKLDMGNWSVELKLSDRQGRQFILSESSQNERSR